MANFEESPQRADSISFGHVLRCVGLETPEFMDFNGINRFGLGTASALGQCRRPIHDSLRGVLHLSLG